MIKTSESMPLTPETRSDRQRTRRTRRFGEVKRNSKTFREGATMVEFAIVAPVFILILLASFEFIRLNMIRNLVQDAAYFAARDSMVPGATASEAEAVAKKVLGFMNTQGAEITINDGNSLSTNSQNISVTITVPIAENSFLIPKFSNGMEFSATATLNTERYSGYYAPE